MLGRSFFLAISAAFVGLKLYFPAAASYISPARPAKLQYFLGAQKA